MATICASPIKARVIRITRLDVCGNPVTGTGGQVVSSGFTQVQASPQYEEGEEFLVKNANGDPCVNEKDGNFLKRVQLQIDLCNIDPDGIVLMTGERLLTTGGPVTGTGVAFGEGVLTARFGIELWQPLAGLVCSTSGAQYFMYWVFPNVGNTMINDFTFENGPFSLSLSSDTKAAGSLWGDGPGTTNWLNGNTMATDEHFAFNITTVAPPLPVCGAQTL